MKPDSQYSRPVTIGSVMYMSRFFDFAAISTPIFWRSCRATKSSYTTLIPVLAVKSGITFSRTYGVLG